jgi:ZIP family zinc transporter
MPDVLAVALAGALTAVATGLGAIPVFLMGARAGALRPALWGFAAGVMTVASVAGLLLPALDVGSTLEVGLGVAVGVAFLLVTRSLLEHRPGKARTAAGRHGLLVFLVLLVHSLPEGFAIGTAWASSVDGLGLFVVLAIALQNVPEGTVTAIPLAEDGASPARQFWMAVATSVPQPIGAVLAFLLVEEIQGLLPVSFAFAGGAMLALTVVDLVPEAMAPGGRRRGAAGIGAGIALMMISVVAIGI